MFVYHQCLLCQTGWLNATLVTWTFGSYLQFNPGLYCSIFNTVYMFSILNMFLASSTFSSHICSTKLSLSYLSIESLNKDLLGTKRTHQSELCASLTSAIEIVIIYLVGFKLLFIEIWQWFIIKHDLWNCWYKTGINVRTRIIVCKLLLTNTRLHFQH